MICPTCTWPLDGEEYSLKAIRELTCCAEHLRLTEAAERERAERERKQNQAAFLAAQGELF